MKTKQYLTVVAILLISSLSAFATNNDKMPGATVQAAAFFTGKPYDSDLGAYVFNYRNYSAEASRWTSADPSGFPDGFNNRVYSPKPTSQLDPDGLMTVNGHHYFQAQDYSSTFPGYWSAADYFGSADATTTATTGTLSMTVGMEGYTLIVPPHDFGRTPEFQITVDSATQNLQYNLVGSAAGSDGSLGAGISYTVEGANTKTLTFHIFGTWGFSATGFGLSVSASGPSVSMTGQSISDGPAGLGTFTFRE